MQVALVVQDRLVTGVHLEPQGSVDRAELRYVRTKQQSERWIFTNVSQNCHRVNLDHQDLVASKEARYVVAYQNLCILLVCLCRCVGV